LVAAICVGLPPQQSRAAEAYYDLGPFLWVNALSADGSVASGERPDSFFYWTAAKGVQFIGGNTASAGMGHGGDSDLSEDGTLLSGNSNPPGSEISEMSIYDISAGTWTALGSIGSSSGLEASSSWGISGNGKSIVGLGWVNAGSAHAIQWREGEQVKDLGSSVPGASSRANETDFDGNIVVGWQDLSDGYRQGAIWVDGEQRMLTYGGEPMSEAQDVTGDGKWVAGDSSYATLDEAFRYNVETGEIDLLGKLQQNLFLPSRVSTGISDDGRTIIGAERDFFSFPPIAQGTIWREGIGLSELTDYALSMGVPLPDGVELTLPLAISADGLTIAGMDNNYNGFVIHVPEPASIGILVIGAMIATLAIRRRG
jgi:uncharacterized membrane protein